MVDEDLQGLLNYAYFFLKFRPRSKKEMKDYLNKKITKKHWSRDDVEKVISELEEENLINDDGFVRWFVEQRNISKPKSQFALKTELFRHGIAKETMEKYFLEHEVDEEELAEKALKSRWSRFKNLDKRKRFEKAAVFLLRRGFSFDITNKTIKNLEED